MWKAERLPKAPFSRARVIERFQSAAKRGNGTPASLGGQVPDRELAMT